MLLIGYFRRAATETPKRDPGRPQRFSESMYELAREHDRMMMRRAALTARRSEQDAAYRLLTIGLLVPRLDRYPQLRRLYDPDRIEAGDTNAWRPSILMELGRAIGKLPHDDWLRVAFQAARTEGRSKDVAAAIRFARRNGLQALLDRGEGAYV